ncbi:IS21-like element helper ATPase IstB [Ruminiclostridium cellobioparum]|uniref:IS21-like element helper ATPase IstB n=1 Tax=Ruminiclostridium cellobioparum TaxID=29355 RepID=UPI0004880E15|nr:IS21-like element helper ATPase IstB [Ruminiclostridium cellobioparum]
MSSDALIKHYCKELRFGKNIYESYSKIAAADFGDFLAQLLKLELDHRELTRKNRNLKSAGFDVIKTFEGYEFGDIQIPGSVSLEELKSGSFIEKLENLILYGPVGTGKSHMATAIGVVACSRGMKAKFFRTASLVNQLSEAKAKGELKRFMKQLEKTDLLICDEWGYVPFEKEGSQLLFQVISECYEKRSVIITTNLEFSKWNGIFYDEKLTSAIIDRLVHHSHLLVFQGQSYRLTHSTMKSH